jgi:hypothetical protein
MAELSNFVVILAPPADIQPSAISHWPLAFGFQLSVFNSAFRAPQPRAALHPSRDDHVCARKRVLFSP